MDPTAAIIGPWTQLGVVGSVVVGLGFVCWTLYKALDKKNDAFTVVLERKHVEHMADVKSCEARVSGLVEKNTDALNGVKGAMESLERVVETAMNKR